MGSSSYLQLSVCSVNGVWRQWVMSTVTRRIPRCLAVWSRSTGRASFTCRWRVSFLEHTHPRDELENFPQSNVSSEKGGVRWAALVCRGFSGARDGVCALRGLWQESAFPVRPPGWVHGPSKLCPKLVLPPAQKPGHHRKPPTFGVLMVPWLF